MSVCEMADIDRTLLTPDERIKYGAKFRWKYDVRSGVMTMPDLQEKFLNEYCLVPRSERPTLQAWADANGVEVRTLYRWKKTEPFIKEWNKRWHQDIAHPDTVVPIIENLMEIAKSKNSPQAVAAAKLYLEMTRQLAPPEVKVTVTPDQTLAKMTDQEIYDRLKGIIDETEQVSLERGDVDTIEDGEDDSAYDGRDGTDESVGAGSTDDAPFGDDTSGPW